jgi:hypothetical protein
MPALRMAANLVSRRIGPALQHAATFAPAPEPAETTSLVPAAPRQMPPGMRRFRGRPVE